MQKRIAVLGSTGSIGTQTLDIIGRHPDRYRATLLVAGRRVDDLIEQARRLRPTRAIIGDESLYSRLHDALAPFPNTLEDEASPHSTLVGIDGVLSTSTTKSLLPVI